MKVPPFVIATELEDSVVVLNLNTKRYYILNSTAGFIWRGITEGIDQPGIVDKMAGEYDATRDRIEASVGRVLDVLKRAQLIL